MRYCLSCRKVTSGDPAYCNYCGKSYDVKRCPRGHVNVRGAEVCAACGSRDLSLPQRPLSGWHRVFHLAVLVVPFVLLLAATLGYMWLFLETLFESPARLLPLMLLGLVLGLLWLIWMHISAALRALLLGPARNKRTPR